MKDFGEVICPVCTIDKTVNILRGVQDFHSQLIGDLDIDQNRQDGQREIKVEKFREEIIEIKADILANKEKLTELEHNLKRLFKT